MNWINRLFSDEKGIPDDARVWSFMLVVSYIWLAFANVYYLKQPVDLTAFGTGSGLLAAAIGAMFKLRGNQ